MSLKTRLLAGASALAVAGGMIGLAAPAAHAAPTVIGNCAGQIGLATFFNSANVATPLGDQTAIGTTIKTKLLKDQTTHVAIAGDCSSATRVGQPENPGGGLVSPLTPKAVAGKLVGNVSCANGATAQAADATAAAAWPANGKITWTMTQLNALAKPWQIQADVALLGTSTLTPPANNGDLINIGGIVLKGAAVGATVSGNLFQDPVAFTGGASGYNTGWELDLPNAAGCADGTPNNASISQTLFGGGAATPSLLGSTGSTGAIFSLGQ